MNNNTLEIIMTRRSVRNYISKQVENDKLQAILEAGCSAPYGLTLVKRCITVVQGKEWHSKINECIRKCHLSIPEKGATNQYIKSLKIKALEENAEFLYNAPIFIIVSTNPNNSSAMVDCAVAIENMLIAAHSLGLGTCWLNQLPGLTQKLHVRELMNSLEIPNDHLIYGSFVLGYPNLEALKSISPRKDTTTINMIK